MILLRFVGCPRCCFVSRCLQTLSLRHSKPFLQHKVGKHDLRLRQVQYLKSKTLQHQGAESKSTIRGDTLVDFPIHFLNNSSSTSPIILILTIFLYDELSLAVPCTKPNSTKHNSSQLFRGFIRVTAPFNTWSLIIQLNILKSEALSFCPQ